VPLLPDFLKRFHSQIRQEDCQLSGNAIVFSRETYQVLVTDPKTKEEIWVFLQLDSDGRLKDTFCSCDAGDNKKGCIHQAIAYLSIYGNHSQALHLRFHRSLWHKLCFSFASEMDDLLNTQFHCEGKKEYSWLDKGNLHFSMTLKTPDSQEKLKKILFEREEATEETSLKFSNLSDKELSMWERGEPSLRLSYELSVWSDLAKYLLSLQELKLPYTIKFTEINHKLPSELSVDFPEIALRWTLCEKILTAIIPSLSTVHSPLRVYYQSKKGVEKITYDAEHRRFVPIFHQETKEVKGMPVGHWTYVPGVGFYSEKHHDKLAEIDLNDVAESLKNHETIKTLLTGTEIHDTPVTLSYHLFFDKEINLHIEGYLMIPGDVDQVFGSWVYHQKLGFYQVKELYFDSVNTIIPALKLSDFITRHRAWLNMQEGFNVHIRPVEADLVYTLSQAGEISFSRQLPFDERAKSLEFDDWVYVEGDGFFSKTLMQTNLPLNPGEKIPEAEIPDFIRKNKEELQLVDHFFSKICPFAQSSVSIVVLEPQKIQIIPHYQLVPEYQNKVYRFFGDFVYVESEGFHELPSSLRLPERFSHEVTIEGKDVSAFIQNDLHALLPKLKEIDPRLKKISGHLVVQDIAYGSRGETKDYTLDLDYKTDLGSLSIAALWRAYKAGERYFCSGAGLIDFEEKQFAWLHAIHKKQIDLQKDTITLSSIEILRLNASNEIEVPLCKNPAQEKAWKLFHELIELKTPEDPDISGLQSHLRPYQEAGVKWLWFLYNHGLSGLLCDDMGLGKTHQAMALLQSSINKRKKIQDAQKKHFLVVCPTSVIYHWQEKLREFLPTLRVWTFYGSNRSLDQFYEKNDLLLTSYGIWRKEAHLLSQYQFDIAIFDELQIAKNQSSRIYKTLLNAKANMRLGMTGTPIENYLRELKSLFDLILPTYFPHDQDFRKFFIHPIEKEGNRERKALLSQLIKPFVLRRKKEDVLLDLPEKTEEIAHCELSVDQRVLYENLLSSSKDRLLKELQDNSNPVPYIHVFALLAHLKQICDHPAVYLKLPEKYKEFSSGKWDLFIELLEESRESGQKVVVFSQYLAMLDIIESYLREKKIGYATIRGATIDRKGALEKFNKDPACEVFVASLQAAGLGIDLTAASVVIHMDRWWNAAREDQATGRVHRIGQTRGVMVFKLMTKGTLEENIDVIIAKKRRLMEDIIGVDDSQVLKQFSRDEIIALLQMK